MSKLLDNVLFFKRRVEPFSNGYGATIQEDRRWEDGYRKRWQYDKVVRSTHGVNCTGSCGWQVYVKGGIVTWETQVLDYPRTRPDLPNHEPRGCARGASASWYLYSSNRIKYPLMRRKLVELWRKAKRKQPDPVLAWASMMEDSALCETYKGSRGKGGFVRVDWDEATELIAAANIYTIKRHGPDRVVGFSPIPAMSMVSYAAGTRYLSLLGGTCLSFYDWYADLPPASPQTWGEQTDVPESADWFNSAFLMVWGSNVPQTRSPDAHFYAEVRYKGTKTVCVTPDFSEAAKFADLWLAPKQGTDAAMGMAMGHVILREFHVDRATPYFLDYCRRFTDMPYLVRLDRQGDRHVPGRFLRASDFDGTLNEANNSEWKTVAFDTTSRRAVVPQGSIGFRWGQDGKWNLEERAGDEDVELALTLLGSQDAALDVAFPYFGGIEHEYFESAPHDAVQLRKVPVRTVQIQGETAYVATVYDLLMAHYGVDRGLGGVAAKSYDDDVPGTPAWQERITGVARQKVISVAREFADTAAKTEGRSMVIIGTGVNQWFNNDMTYRSVINMLMMCGCVGKSGGGWAHYVGQEKLRPQPGWSALAFATDWGAPPRQMNGTSYWYAHTDQWRYEKVTSAELLSPLAPEGDWQTLNLIDYNVRSERMGWLPSSPQLEKNPLDVARDADAAGQAAPGYVARSLKEGALRLSCEDPDNPKNFPRNLIVWRSNLLGSSSKGHEYFLKHLLGAQNAVQGGDLGANGESLPTEVEWHPEGPEGKLDLLVTIDFRMSSNCMYSDIVLPTATWYEKNDLSTTDMHPFIHPLTGAVDPVWEARSDWEIFRGLAKRFSELCPGHLGVEKDVVLQPLMHDAASELGQPLNVQDWKRGDCEPVPGQTMPNVFVAERDYPATYDRFTSLGPLLEERGLSTKGITWDPTEEVHLVRELNGVARSSNGAGLPRIETDVQACEVILALSPETNGRAAAKAWRALEQRTGRSHTHLSSGREADSIRFHDVVAQPRKVITSPTWSGVESESVSYNAGYINVTELIPWRTLTGRQQFYQDHEWMRAFGEGFATYKPPLDTKTIAPVLEKHDNGQPQRVLNFLTPHQKWGIHSSFTDTQAMLTLSRGGPCVWLSEQDAAALGIEDNDWIEAFNVNGSLAARAVVSQRIKTGCAYMYHSQDKTVFNPGTETTGTRGIHNSISRIVVKPTHMIGGYAHQSYGFNYYGTVGANRDDFVVIRKMRVVDFRDGTKPLVAEAAS